MEKQAGYKINGTLIVWFGHLTIALDLKKV